MKPEFISRHIKECQTVTEQKKKKFLVLEELLSDIIWTIILIILATLNRKL